MDQKRIEELKFIESELLGPTSKKRWTKDNRQCASAFVQDGKTYTDCTTVLTPDKQVTGREWCYVDPNSGGTPKWAFCKPILDYDQVRIRARDLIIELTTEIRRVSSLVYEQIPPASKTIALMEKLENQQSEIDLRAGKLELEVKQLLKSYEYIQQLKEKWELIDKDIEELDTKVDAVEEAERNGDNMNNPKNCQGLLGYGKGAKNYSNKFGKDKKVKINFGFYLFNI